MFRALLAHPQEAQCKQHLVYCVCVMSVGCTRIEVELVQPTDITCKQYTKCYLCSSSWGWASNAQNMYRPLIINKLNKKCIILVLLYWYAVTIFILWSIYFSQRFPFPISLQLFPFYWSGFMISFNNSSRFFVLLNLIIFFRTKLSASSL
jgi:hypothetical protein